MGVSGGMTKRSVKAAGLPAKQPGGTLAEGGSEIRYPG